MKINAESFLLSTDNRLIDNNIYFITGNDQSVIDEVENKITSGIENIAFSEIKKTELENLDFFEKLLGQQDSLFASTKICVHKNPINIDIDIFDNLKTVSIPVLIQSPKTKNGSKLKNYFDSHKKFISISCYKIGPEFKKKIVYNYLNSKKIKLDDASFWFLIDSLPTNYRMILSELDKISNLNKKNIDLEDLRSLLSLNTSYELDDLFFSIIHSKNKIILLSNKTLLSSQDSFMFIQKFKFFYNIFLEVQKAKNNGEDRRVVENLWPKYLFKNKHTFLIMIDRLSRTKMDKINKILARAEILLRKGGERGRQTILIQRLLLNTKTILG